MASLSLPSSSWIMPPGSPVSVMSMSEVESLWMQLMAVNGSLMPFDMALTATSTSWSIANSMSWVSVRSQPVSMALLIWSSIFSQASSGFQTVAMRSPLRR